MAITYKARIMAWAWDAIVSETRFDAVAHVNALTDNPPHDDRCVDGCDGGGHVGCYYLGSVMSLAPSGKFYTFWTTNQTARDVERDGAWYAALDAVANKYEGWIEAGEGDPTDLYFCRYWPTPERND
jgi:hypothetical protein